MKTTFFLGSALILAAAAPLYGSLPPKVVYTSPKLEIVFQHPSKFSDIRDQYQPTDSGELNILDELHRALVRDANYDVPNGDRMTMTFTDIKLAGDFEPERGPNWGNVRIIRSVYVPYFNFTYRLMDGSGRVLRHGTVHLTDLNFQDRVMLNTSDPLRYEKDILRGWMSEHAKP
ncbi:MAG: DUF3016 domain-containing protein [Opitutaceae bacterium]